MPAELRYEALERLHVGRPVDRIAFIAERCRDKVVLDIGCLDETALVKRDTDHWLHSQIAKSAKRVIGVDNSPRVPSSGLVTAPNATIIRGDGMNLGDDVLAGDRIDTIVAGEFIEHIENPLAFLRDFKSRMPGRLLILSTPNGVAFANTLLGVVGRESQHQDHLANFTFKILNTLLRRAEITDWEIFPYRFYATEMILGSKGLKRACALTAERGIRVAEWCFPLLSFGYVVTARL